jgi:hypothetical protein
MSLPVNWQEVAVVGATDVCLVPFAFAMWLFPFVL